MSLTVSGVSLTDAVARYHAAVAQLAAADLTVCTDAELLEAWRGIERDRCVLATVDHALISEVEQRGVAPAAGCANVAALARAVLRVNPGEAHARVAAARACGSRRSLSGELLEPVYPGVAAAQAAGEVSARHAQIIVKTVEGLPHEVAAVLDRAVEATLLDTAREHDPDVLAHVARALAYRLDQDGQYNEAQHRDRTRGLSLRRRSDGSGRLDGELTAECAEYLETVLDTLTRPAPRTVTENATDSDSDGDTDGGTDGGTDAGTPEAGAPEADGPDRDGRDSVTDGGRDPRTPAQRRHDGLLTALKLTMQANLLPKAAGVSATIVLTTDLDAYGTGRGIATTAHGYTIPVDIAKTWGGEETRTILVLLSKTKGIEAYSAIQRIYTEQQRLAMTARDAGCSFPTCDAPMSWTESHHMTEWRQTRRTSVDDGALLCSHHHNHFHAMGWTGAMINGRPHWTPPKHLDPDQIPRRNTLHNRRN